MAEDKKLQTLLETIVKKVNSLVPAVGDIEINTTGINPSKKYPGTTWIQWGAGRVPVGVDTTQTDFAKVEKTGGNKTVNIGHTHSVTTPAVTSGGTAITVAQMPGHAHRAPKNFWFLTTQAKHHTDLGGFLSGDTNKYVYLPPTEDWADFNATASTGGNQPHTHSVPAQTVTSTNASLTSGSTLQPYITCYMWKRTA